MSKKPRKRASVGKTNRNKGNSFERLLAKIMRELGYEYCKTSRATSRLMDNCKIDLTGLPFIVQAKAGYDKSRPKYDKIFGEIKEEIGKHFPPSHHIHDMPIILIHKIDGKKQENWTWTFNHKDIMDLLTKYQNLLHEQDRKIL